MNDNVESQDTIKQKLLELVGLTVGALMVEHNMTHHSILQHIRTHIVDNISPSLMKHRVLYVKRGESIEFSKPFNLFFSRDADQTMTIKDRSDASLHQHIYLFGVHTGIIAPFLYTCLYHFTVYRMQDITDAWIQLNNLEKQVAKADKCLTRCTSFNACEFLRSEVQSNQTSLLSILNMLKSNPAMQAVFSFCNHCKDKLQKRHKHLQTLKNNEQFLVASRTCMFTALEKGLFIDSWAYQCSYDVFMPLVLCEMIKEKNVRLNETFFNDHKNGWMVFDIFCNGFVNVSSEMVEDLTYRIGLMTAAAPWCHLEITDVPGGLDWTIEKCGFEKEKVVF